MKVYIGADHRGFELKEQLKKFLTEKDYDVEDCGNTQYDKDDDYPDFGAAVAQKVGQSGEEGRGIIVCGSGIGISIAANKFPGVRATIGINPDHVFHGRDADNINVLALAPDYTDQKTMEAMVEMFLKTPFSDEARHNRRISKVASFEK